jgi:two-component system cell cycle response regulator DivK
MTWDYNNIWKDKFFLIVEDDPASSMLLEIILSRTGAKLLFAESGEKALGILKRNKGIDLILMDIKLGGISGIQTTIQIKKIFPDLPVIAQTACVVYGDKELCIQSGCSDYISKPIITNLLLEVINNQLNRKISNENLKVSSLSN